MTEPTDWLRPLGTTGLVVSGLCMGGGPLGSMPGNFGYEVSEREGVEAVRAVLNSPIRFLDTSNGYSDGASERRVGIALAENGGLPADFLVATKVDPAGRDYSAVRVRASVQESKRRLGLDFLPLVYLHDPEGFEFESMRPAVDELLELKREGEIGHVGLAGGDVRVMSRYLDLGAFEVTIVHNRWTLVDRSATELIEQATESGIAVVNAAVYGGGILASGTGSRYGYRPASRETLASVAAMVSLCARHGTDIATAAVAFSYRDARVASTILGFSKPSRIGPAVAAASADLPADFWAELETLVPSSENWLDAD
jgi:D-threo-aldose 1-dehydrogenase